MARSSASPITWRHRLRSRRGSGSGTSSPSESLLAAGATERPIVFGGNDRPGVMLASAVRTYVNRFAVAPGRQRRGVHRPATTAGVPPADLALAGVQVVAVVDPRADVADALRALATGAARHLGAQRDRHAAAARALRAVDVTDARRAHADARRRPARRFRRLESQRRADHASWRQGRVVGRDDRGFRAGSDPPTAMARRRRRRRDLHACRLPARTAREAGREAAARLGLGASTRQRYRAERRMLSRSRRCGMSAARAARPSSTCRTTSRPRTSRSRIAKVSARSSISSATPRSAWRPTRARPRMSTASPSWPR